jgi:hypothetical protein
VERVASARTKNDQLEALMRTSACVSWKIRIPVLLASLLGFVAQAHAVDTLLTGEQLQLTGRQLTVRSRDAAIDLGGGPGSSDDPVLHGGSVRVLSIEGDVFDTTYPLPAARWRYATTSASRPATPSAARV